MLAMREAAAPVRSPNAMYPNSMICDRPIVCESRGLCSRMVTTDTISWRSSWILIVVSPLVETGAHRGTMLAWLRSRLPSTVTAAGHAGHHQQHSWHITWLNSVSQSMYTGPDVPPTVYCLICTMLQIVQPLNDSWRQCYWVVHFVADYCTTSLDIFCITASYKSECWRWY